MPKFIVTTNTPGYMPEESGTICDTFDEAMEAAKADISDLIGEGMVWDSDYTEPDYYRADLSDPTKTHDLGVVVVVTRFS